MRKSTAVTMAIILLALVAMMMAADMALKPYERYARMGKELTSMLELRGEVVKGSKVVAVATKSDDRHLAKEGWGMVVELEPSEPVRRARGRLAQLAYRAATQAGRIYAGSGKPLDWYEIRMRLAPETERKTLIRVDEEGRLGPLDPALPPAWP